MNRVNEQFRTDFMGRSIFETHPGHLLLRVNLVILGGCREIQVPLAISSAYSHPVYFVLARSTIQTVNKKYIYLYRRSISFLSRLATANARSPRGNFLQFVTVID